MATGSVRLILTKASGQVINLAQAQDSVSVFIETRDFAPSGDDQYTYIDELVTKIKNRVGSTGLLLTIKYRNRMEDPLTSFQAQDLSLNDQPIFPRDSSGNPVPSSVFYKLRFDDVQLVNRWRLFGLQAFGEADGRYS